MAKERRRSNVGVIRKKGYKILLEGIEGNDGDKASAWNGMIITFKLPEDLFEGCQLDLMTKGRDKKVFRSAKNRGFAEVLFIHSFLSLQLLATKKKVDWRKNVIKITKRPETVAGAITF